MKFGIQKIFQEYKHVMDDLSDPRTKDWWLMSGPGPLLIILAIYLFFCNYAGPLFMKDKNPYKLKNIIIIYNFVHIIMSVFITYMGIEYIFATRYNFKCQSVDFSDNPVAVKATTSVWWYFFSKITELLDTVFFVLRKKDNQVTFLHLYHHTSMPILSWIGTKYCAGGQAILEGCMNACVHIFMYGYYFLAALGPQYQKYLWWKKYLTTLQLIQFCVVIYLNVIGLCDTTCGYPKYMNVLILASSVAFLYMFGSFYYRSYIKKDIEKSLTMSEKNAKLK